jgi:pimeloyl-ACP methyl ester carboxylesterase
VREDLRKRIEDATPVSTIYAQMRAIAGHDTRARLAELAGLPVLVLHGTDDALVPPDRGRALAEGIPGARHMEVPGAGHVLTTDAEEAVAGAILDHLERAGAPTAA